MTLDQLIAKLQSIKRQSEGFGGFKVFISCPVAGADCWLKDENIQLDDSTDGSEIQILRIIGGIGA